MTERSYYEVVEDWLEKILREKYAKKMKIDNLCSGCAVPHTPSKEHQGTLVLDGGPATTVGPAGKRGHWQEDTYSYKCPKCEALWEKLVET